MEETSVLYQIDSNSYQELMEEAQKLAHFGGWEVNILTGAVKWSSEMYNLLGYDPTITEATFNNFIKKLHREDILYVKRNLQNLLNIPSTDTYDFRIVNDDGTIKYLRTGIVVKRNRKGRAIIMTGFSQDITEKKLLEIEREKISADLVQRNMDQEQFNYMISHNLRAPVANIAGLLALLNDPEIDEEEKNFVLTGISSSIKSLDSVITDMNHILQARECINETREVNNLEGLVSDIKFSINNIIQKEQVLFKCHFEVENVTTIRSYLYSIFYNLILNSIKYRQTGLSPIITIESSFRENKVILTFTDNCRGIDMQSNGAQLFRLYRRFDTSVEGKGMGLFMVKTQVESLGGTISVTSELDKGTRFNIELPV